MSRASGGHNTPKRNWNNIPDLLGEMPTNKLNYRFGLEYTDS